MRNTRRPAWPVVFLFGVVAAAGLAADNLDELLRLNAEIATWKRVRMPGTAEQAAVLERSRLQATREWVERWPNEELAWRERLRALARSPGPRADFEEALAGTQRALGARPQLRFPVDTRFLMAGAAVAGMVRLTDVQGWLEEAEESVLEELPAGRHPLVAAYRRERLSEARWRSSNVRAELAYRMREAAALRAAWGDLLAESAVPVLDAADRIARAERARRRTQTFKWRARLAQLRGERESAKRFYQRALAARPVQPAASEPLEHAQLIEEALQAGAKMREGTPIPPAASAGPHWLPTVHRLEAFEPDGRPSVVAVWAAGSAVNDRAMERLQRQRAVRIGVMREAEPELIRAVNPLYTAPQLWVVDRMGVVRLVGRLQPGGDGWEDSVTGAALRLP